MLNIYINNKMNIYKISQYKFIRNRNIYINSLITINNFNCMSMTTKKVIICLPTRFLPMMNCNNFKDNPNLIKMSPFCKVSQMITIRIMKFKMI